ncbi:MAG: L-serine ammonia-lyase [Rickettsiales bacterium]|jgi:L-serine dehydratase|nr:L-serine ammonia-lyase [Rickettsiales bacterium]
MITIFDIFKIGIGPSSSHTFGPMVAANMFLKSVENEINNIESIRIDLYGSLALTGKGHATFLAIELGLEGWTPDRVTPDELDREVRRIKIDENIKLAGKKEIYYTRENNFIVHRTEVLDYHSNGMAISAFKKNGDLIYTQTYYSIGGGFVLEHTDISKVNGVNKGYYEFVDFQGLMEICSKEKKTIYDVVLKNELEWRTHKEIDEGIQKIVDVMEEMIENGLNRKGNLQGSLNLPRRAPILAEKLKDDSDPLNVFEWVELWGLAAAEENASLGKLITAPTNGAAGLIPAVIKFIKKYHSDKWNLNNLKRFIFVSGAVGILCKRNATISGAEGGCQAEIGVACSMAAAGLCALLGGTDLQIENAAVMALVHNFGLTCDPIGGLVQVPCIERNPINSVKAIACARLALREEKSLFVTLDQAILTMKQVGCDLQSKYKETAQGGLAVNSRDGRNTVIPRSVMTPCMACKKKNK